MRRVSSVDLMLLGTVLLWALNITVTKYVLQHGFRPLAYASIRYLAATSLFWAFTLARERTVRIRLSDGKLIALAALLIFTNQLTFVYGIHRSTAATFALILGTTPIFIGVYSVLFGLERISPPFWLAAAVSFAGVGFVAAGSGGFSASLAGDGMALFTAASWAGYSVAIAPLLRRYSPFRVSALVLAVGWVPLALAGSWQISQQSFHFNTWTWVGFGYAVVGPLFLTNILWFTAIDRVGASRASLFGNMQPFFAVVFALVILGEHLNRWEIVGGVAIGAGIVLERVFHARSGPATDTLPT